MNIFVLNKGGSKIGVLSNQGAKPPAPFFDDLFTQELETGADTYYFSSISNSSTESLFAIGNKIMFEYNNKQRLFTIASIEYEHKEGQKIIGVYAEGIGFELLDVFMKKPKIEKEPGNDSDLDGDDDYDDEYGDPDDVWIDADGNIVYIKNRNENGDDYGSPDDVWIDEDGNICYKKNRNDRDRDSLEIKQLSYPNFLNLILKNTGWSYECQPGLESNKQDMSIRYNTNIYAILQDSMQTYQGVELEFIYEYNNGSIKRVVKAYKNGGRGSKTGKRLQYGVNVRGITKMQEIVDEYDEDVIYEGIATINGHKVQLTYDVDIALKSMDVESMRIGDGYTVIDHDFRPAIEFAARIGKIEISFSDPTMNKCYIANFKQIRGAVSENGGTDEDDVKDLIEDAIGETDIGDHTHDRLVYPENEEIYTYIDAVGLMPVCSEGVDELGQGYRTEIDLGSDMNRWRTLYASSANFYNDFNANDCVTQILPGAINMKNSSDNLENIYNRITYSGINFFDWPDSTYYYRGILNPYSVFLKDRVNKSFLTAGGLSSPRTFAYNHSLYFDREDMNNIREIQAEGLPGTVVSEGDESISTHEYEEPIVTKKDLLNFILNEVKIHEYMPKPLDAIHDDVNLSNTGVYLGLLSDDYIDHSDADNCVWNSLVGTKIFRNIVSDVDDDGIITDNEGHEKHTYSLNALVCALIGAFQQYALTQVMNYATVDYVKKSVDNVDAWTNALQVVSEGDEGIEPLAGTADKINGGYIMDSTLKGSQVSKSGTNNILTTTDIVDSVTSTSTNKPASAAAVKKAYDKAVQALNNSGGNSGNTGSGDNCDFDEVFTFYPGDIDELTSDYVKLKKELRTDCDISANTIWANSIHSVGGKVSGKQVEAKSNLVLYGMDSPYLTNIDLITDLPNNGAEPPKRTITAVDLFDAVEAYKGSGAPSGGNGNVFDTITVRKIKGPDAGEGQYNIVDFENAIRVSQIYPLEGWDAIDFMESVNVHGTYNIEGDAYVGGDIYANSFVKTSDRALKENIRYIDAPATYSNNDNSNDLLEKADLYDFIVNQLNICEYNYIGYSKDNIGLIANDYEGTKVGDKIVFKDPKTDLLGYDVNNLLFSTIGALQEEVRKRDEQIAALEARLARIEQYLDLGDDI